MDNKKIFEEWAPESITYKTYSRLTSFRVPMFYALLILVFVTAICSDTNLPSVRPELFLAMLNKMVNLLLAAGTIITTFFTIALGIIVSKEKPGDVTALWEKFAKYIIYPFAVAILIGIILFLKEMGLDIHKTDLSFALLVLFGYLTINSVYVIVKAGEELVNAGWPKKAKSS